MNKSTIIKIGILLLVFVAIGTIIYLLVSENTSDEIKFKKEYESLNGEKNDAGKKYMRISISKDNNVKYASYDEVMELLDKGTGILYLGFPECPWCRNALPVLLKAAKENEVANIYYFNALSIRDIKELKNGKIVTTKKGTKKYYNLVNRLEEHLGPYQGLEDESIKRIYFPTVVFVMGGEVVGLHVATVNSQDDPYKKLSKDQERELFDIYTKHIDAMFGICDESC